MFFNTRKFLQLNENYADSLMKKSVLKEKVEMNIQEKLNINNKGMKCFETNRFIKSC